MPIASFSLVALDCPDPVALAEFYRGIVGGEIRQDPPDEMTEWVRLQIDDSSDIGFQLNENYAAPGWPNGLPQQAHLDFDVVDLVAGEAAAIDAGAVKAEVQPDPEHWLVFFDPAGHPFCLCLVKP